MLYKFEDINIERAQILSSKNQCCTFLNFRYKITPEKIITIIILTGNKTMFLFPYYTIRPGFCFLIIQSIQFPIIGIFIM